MKIELQITQLLSDEYHLECLIEKKNSFLKEYFHSSFSARITHAFIEDQCPFQRNNILFRMDHFTGYMLITRLTDHTNFLIGPYLSKSITNPNHANYFERFHIRYKDQQDFSDYLHNLPKLSYNESIRLFQKIYFLVNHIEISELDIPFINMNTQYTHQADLTFNSALSNSSQGLTASSAYDTYISEIRICNYIKNGDANGLLNYWQQEQIPLYSGLCGDAVSDLRNTGIAAVTLASHYAIDGGLSITESFRLMELYILLLTEEDDVDSLLSLMSSALLRFAKNVNESKLPENIPPVIHSAVTYLKSHITESFSVKQLADFLHINQTYLSKQFSHYMNCSISVFMMKLKIEKAKELLQLTDCSLAMISEELCFSSQPHFQKVFKQYTDMTPNDYRMKYGHYKI